MISYFFKAIWSNFSIREVLAKRLNDDYTVKDIKH